MKKAIVSQQLIPGEKFPSVRQLSKELRINPNTAQKVVTHLVDLGLLEVRPGIGTLVCSPGPASEKERQQILDTEVEHLVVEAKRLSVKKQELFDSINRQWSLGKK